MKDIKKLYVIALCFIFIGCVADKAAKDIATLSRIDGNGEFGWYELMSPNVEESVEFYTKLFGWTTVTMQKSYNALKNKDKKIGGIMPLSGNSKNNQAYWLPYITVADIDKTVIEAKKMGAKILIEPTYAPDVGRFAILQDPHGAMFSVITYIRK